MIFIFQDTLCRNLINGGIKKEIVEVGRLSFAQKSFNRGLYIHISPIIAHEGQLLSTQSSSNSTLPTTQNVTQPPGSRFDGSESQGRLTSTPSYQIRQTRPINLLPCSNSKPNLSIKGETQGRLTSTPSSQNRQSRPIDLFPCSNLKSNLYIEDETQLNESYFSSNSSENSGVDAPSANEGLLNSIPRPMVEPVATRTVELLNLCKGTTMADITSVVRGGLLVNIYIRPGDNTAVLSFLHESDARTFYQHVRTDGLYVNNAKVTSLSQSRRFCPPN
jgi:hypothetical protein